MSKELKSIKPCFILDKLREWFELYGNQNYEEAEKDLGLALDELYKYQQNDNKIKDLEAKLAESEKALEAKESVNRMYKATLSLKDSDFSDLVRENAKLKQQLAEKEKQCQECKHLNKKIELNIKNKLMAENGDLQQQLNEKDQAIESLEELNRSLGQTCNNDIKEIERLNKEIAEKEKEIEDLKAQRHIYLNRSVEECNKITYLEFELQHKDQDKISFCIEQLEKVKDYNYTLRFGCSAINEFIDDQIKLLKEGK